MTKEEEGVDVISSKKGIQICIREKHATMPTQIFP